MTTQILAYDEIDDLIYYSRAGDLTELQEVVRSLSKKYNQTSTAIFQAAIDVDAEGLGSQSCLLHYPAANGNLEIVQYLLGQSKSEEHSLDGTKESANGDRNGTTRETTKENIDFINHRNVSGNTPLHWAGMNGHLKVVKALIHAGADPEIVNGAGRDAVVESEWSSKPGADECAVWMLKECGGLEKGIGEEGRDAEALNGDDADTTNDMDITDANSNNLDGGEGPSTANPSG